MTDDERLGNNLERYGVLDNEIWDWMFSDTRWIGTYETSRDWIWLSCTSQVRREMMPDSQSRGKALDEKQTYISRVKNTWLEKE